MISKPAVALLSEAAMDVIPFQECHVAGARVSPAQKQYQGMIDNPVVSLAGGRHSTTTS